MIKSFGIPGESLEIRPNPDAKAPDAPWVLMSGDRSEPHHVCKVVDGVGVWVEPVENIRKAQERAREVMNPLRDTFLNRLSGIAVFSDDDAVKQECALLRQQLLDITKDEAFLAAETYAAMEAALMTRYRLIAVGASDAIRNVFRELEV